MQLPAEHFIVRVEMVCRDVVVVVMLARVTETKYKSNEPLTIYIVLILTLITTSQAEILYTPFRTPGAKGSLSGSEP